MIMKIAAIIQARIGSTRLPRKAMLKIKGKPLLFYMIQQVKKSDKLNDIIVITSKKKENNIIRNFCIKNNINCFSGDEKNLVKRYFQAAKKYNVDIIVRLTSDCPLIDPRVIDKCINKFLSLKYDFVGNTSPPFNLTYPDGMDVEIFSKETLKYVFDNCKNTSDLEHVTPFIWRKKKFFKLCKLDSKKNLSKFRLTVDYKEDFILVKKIIEYFLANEIKINLKNIIFFLNNNSKVYSLNKMYNKKFRLEKNL
jgi:spore coat polysaccharide biosynthesis protein SpsF